MNLNPACQQLDEAMALIDNSPQLQPATRSQLKTQGVLYASFINDVQSGRTDACEVTQRDMADLIGEFCMLIQSELNPTVGAAQ
jgi:hypothetical protein|tara:strand:+ start:781 stop:1032 length:252 start_codon:yes stop_codon:yes gene_type:complete